MASSGGRSQVPRGGPPPALTDPTLSRSTCESSSLEAGSVEPTCPGLSKHGACPLYPLPGEREGVCHASPTVSLGLPLGQGAEHAGTPDASPGPAGRRARCGHEAGEDGGGRALPHHLRVS